MSEEALGLIPLLFSVVMLAPLCIGITRAAAAGRLLHNGGVGIRTRKTTRSQAAWQAGHAAALPIINHLWWMAGATVTIAVLVQWQAGGSWGIVAGLAGMGAEVAILMHAAKAAGHAAERS